VLGIRCRERLHDPLSWQFFWQAASEPDSQRAKQKDRQCWHPCQLWDFCAMQALLAAHSEIYSESRMSFTFTLPDNTSRWAVQLHLDSLKFDANTSAAELQVGFGQAWHAREV
jgi:hypothetical protein